MEADGEIRPLNDGRPTEDGDALVIATSGTSGEPKGVIHTHASIAASARAIGDVLQVDRDHDRWLACLPLAHIGGLAVVLRALVTDTEVEVHDGFDGDSVIDAAKRGATLVSLVTRALNQVPANLFRTVLIGGAAPPPDRPANVIATYGMTETGSGVVYQTPTGATGDVDQTGETIVLDGLEIMIRPVEAVDQSPEPGAEGEILLRGPMLFRAYRSGPDPFDEDGWFATGDLGTLTDGTLTVAGRRGDVIVTGGEKVWPEPVERILLDRPDVAQVALVGRPDPDWGHRVVAVVVVEAGFDSPDLADIRSTVTERLPVWAAPKELEFVDDLPRTSLGKVRRNLL